MINYLWYILAVRYYATFHNHMIEQSLIALGNFHYKPTMLKSYA